MSSSLSPAETPFSDLAKKKVLLDTSIQIDRVKSGHREATITERIRPYQFRFATSFGQLEFKATVIQEMITIHGALSRPGAKFTEVRDYLTESQHRQRSLRGHIFNNILAISASSLYITTADDIRLAETSRLLLQDHIPECYERFTKSVDVVLRDKLTCDRATEVPIFRKATYAPNIPKCKRLHNKKCHVESLLRSAARLKPDLERLASPETVPEEADGEPINQFRKTLNLIERVEGDVNCDLTSNDCRNAGDLLIALEAEGTADHAMSTNAREWQPLCKMFGFEFVTVQYHKPT